VKKLGVRAVAIQADSADAAAVTKAVDQAATELGGLDVLVNNAGIAKLLPVDELELADFDRTFAINVRAVFVATKAAAKHMGDGGRVINIGSCNAERMPFPGGSAYAMSKAALVGLVKGLARDLGPRGITVNNVQPGPVDTDMNPATGSFADSLRSLMAVQRYAHGDEIAAMVAYLAGPETGMVTGASLMIDGGFTA
jgi:3-oxoacyl-[acyl-carrier protein] reductase